MKYYLSFVWMTTSIEETDKCKKAYAKKRIIEKQEQEAARIMKKINPSNKTQLGDIVRVKDKGRFPYKGIVKELRKNQTVKISWEHLPPPKKVGELSGCIRIRELKLAKRIDSITD